MPNLMLLFVSASLAWGAVPVVVFALIGCVSNHSSIVRRIGLCILGVLCGLAIVPLAALLAEYFIGESPPWYAVRTIGACIGSLVAFHLAGFRRPSDKRLVDHGTQEHPETAATKSDNPYAPPKAE